MWWAPPIYIIIFSSSYSELHPQIKPGWQRTSYASRLGLGVIFCHSPSSEMDFTTCTESRDVKGTVDHITYKANEKFPSGRSIRNSQDLKSLKKVSFP